MKTQTLLTTQRWLVEPEPPQPDAAVRLICMPYAGAGAVVYRPWRQALPSRVALSIAQLPGRETRLREDPVRRMELLIEALTEAVAPLAARPYALFGHSMGALVAFELARALRRIGVPPPVCLFVSGRRAPQLPETEPHVHQLADGPFVGAMVRRYNAIPRVILEDIELLRLFLPALRADLEVIETYAYTSEAPLGCPIVALGGASDVRATADDLEAWRTQTAAGFEVVQFPGGHFYLQTERRALIDQIVRALGGQQGAER